MKYYIIAGEASGDLHGSKLIEEIKKMTQIQSSGRGVVNLCQKQEVMLSRV